MCDLALGELEATIGIADSAVNDGLADLTGDDEVDGSASAPTFGTSKKLPSGGCIVACDIEALLDVFLRSCTLPVLNWTRGDDG